ncbi:unnamed protein product [Paramecium primaurelia]|uniref:Uncharacterized protein n=1 Tax=Paramecium primaurelia TaxID=5886 RepID=A0A8S1LFU3_PARPR|nr:unnamed protein product [Paramecium primaurelia]
MGPCISQHPVSTEIDKRGSVCLEEGQLQEKDKPQEVQAEAQPLSSYDEQNVIKIQSGFRGMKARKEAGQEKEQLENTKPKNDNIKPYNGTVESCNDFIKDKLLLHGEYNYNTIYDEQFLKS